MELKEGDELSLGVSGQAIYDDMTGTTGIWVSAVNTDSPAGELGLQGGDIIEKIEGLSIGVDGTMKDYCDILRSHDETDPHATPRSLRYADDARLRGEFNGDELEAIESLGTVMEETGPLRGTRARSTRSSSRSATTAAPSPSRSPSVGQHQRRAGDARRRHRAAERLRRAEPRRLLPDVDVARVSRSRSRRRTLRSTTC